MIRWIVSISKQSGLFIKCYLYSYIQILAFNVHPSTQWANSAMYIPHHFPPAHTTPQPSGAQTVRDHHHIGPQSK